MKTQKIIDVHSHMLFKSYLDGLKEMNIDPVKEDGFPTPKWSVNDHLLFMKELGIETCILSLSTPHIHHGDDNLACRLARTINDESAALCKNIRISSAMPLSCHCRISAVHLMKLITIISSLAV